MKRKSPISIDRIQFYTYERYEDDRITFFIDQFSYDDRRDFAVDNDLAGVAVKLCMSNDRYDRGVRRKLKLSLIDLTSRCEVASEYLKVNIRKDMFIDEKYVNFPSETTALIGGHSYKLTVCDIASSLMLTETIFHLLDENTLGHPSKWYEINCAGIKPAWESNTYKVLKTVDCHDYYIMTII